MSSRSLALVLTVLAAVFLARTGSAAWPHSPATNVLVSGATTSFSYAPCCVTDGAGGAIIVWVDTQTGTDIYAQRVSATGSLLWTAGGVAVTSLAASSQTQPTATADGSGGVIIAWADNRNGNADIYAQRLTSTGAIAAGSWVANGVRLNSLSNDDGRPQIVADGAGGAIVAYINFLTGSDYDVYAQRVDGNGTIHAGWNPAYGATLCFSTGIQDNPVLCSDGAAGAIVSWEDHRGGTYDVYAARVTAAGAVPWTGDGVPIETAGNDQRLPRIASDDAGGALIAWEDFRSGSSFDVYCQHVTGSGSFAGGWSFGAVALCTASDFDEPETVVPDGLGGALVAMTSKRSGVSHIYVQHVTGGGTISSGWPDATVGGVALSSPSYVQDFSPAVSDGAGGAVVAWRDGRGATYDAYASRITGSGALAAGWVTNGAPISFAPGDQMPVVLCSDGASGAIIAWIDNRAAPQVGVYAQRIERFGQLGDPEPKITKVKDVPNDQGGKLKLSWDPSYLDNDPQFGIANYWIWRSVPGSVAAAALRRGAHLLSADGNEEPRPGVRTFKTTVMSGTSYSWEYVGSQVAQAFPGYSMVMPVSSDSMFESNPYTAFMVEAKPPSGNAYWNSAPDSGYSVDNLGPVMPAPFTGQWLRAAGTALQWGANHEADLAGYLLYRGASAGFVPGPTNLVTGLAGTSYTDPAGTNTSFYKLAAVDAHGNVSPYALLVPSGTVDVPAEELPREVGLLALGPNPVREEVALRFALPREAAVSLAIYDASGRRIRGLTAETWPAGTHDLRWDGRDEAGRRTASGLYLVRLEAEGRVIVRRFLTLR